MKKLTAEDAETRSPDVVAENVEQLKTIFPEAFTEEKVDFEVLKQLLGGVVEEREEKYGLNWHGKRRARQLALTPSTGTLRPCPKDSVDWDTTKNLMIEGDNLEVLKLLQKSYSGKVKLIYIDPPYNTGKDFVYPDDFRDNIKNYLELTGQTDGEGRKISSNTEASGRFHTDWLNMMYPRLKLAKNLLRDDGVIFISIDDSEASTLRKICDEVFGEDNFISCIVWRKKTGAGAVPRGFIPLHEYILCYGKNFASFDLISPLSEKTKSMYNKQDEHYSTLGPYATWPLDTTSMDTRENLRFPIQHQGTQIWPKKQWLWSRERVEIAQADNKLVFNFNERDQSWSVRFKGYLLDSDGEEKLGKPTTMILDILTQEGTKDFAMLFPREIFQFPKPVKLIKNFLAIETTSIAADNPRKEESDIVLDFFAGSGTTGQAVMSQNAADGGNRRYVLVQLPEPLDLENKDQTATADYFKKLGNPLNIAELTKERLRRAGKKIREENPMFAGDLGFRVFKLASSNIRAWEPNRDDLPSTLEASIEHLKTDRTEQDILFELLLKLGLDLTIPIEQKSIASKAVHNIGAGTLLVCLAEQIAAAEVEPLALGIAAWHKELTPAGETTVVFRDSAFADDVAKTNLTAILQQHGLENVRSL
jgi:adenine-specific DNA-methyltransferase